VNCQQCGLRPATIRCADVVDGSPSTWHLCEKCARERGVTGSLTSLAGPLVNILMGLLEGDACAEPGGERACPRCGLTYGQFRRVGRLGCATCYETFGGELKPLLRRIHGSTDHEGRVPPDVAGDHERRREVKRLKAELAHAVHAEDYERAAALRDALRAVEAEPGAPGAATERADEDL
jgi:protein arginine kinase activator